MQGNELRITYGFEQFFVPTDAKRPPSDALRSLKAIVRVAVDGSGIVEDVRIDGVPYATWLESQ